MLLKINNHEKTERIQPITGADRVRKRPAVIFGSEDAWGCLFAVREILKNAVMEASLGFGKEIIIKRLSDGSYEITDFGRGIPVLYDEKEKMDAWKYNFCEIYAAGPYEKLPDGCFRGIMGIYLCAVQYASLYMDAIIKRDGNIYSLHFEKGENIGGLKTEKNPDNTSGTTLRFKPDAEVFCDTNVTFFMLEEMIAQTAKENPGIKFTFVFCENEESITRIYE